MNKGLIFDIVYFLVAIMVSVIIFKLFIWLLPIILIAILAFYIYRAMKSNRRFETSTNNSSTTKKKKIIVIDSDDVD